MSPEKYLIRNTQYLDIIIKARIEQILPDFHYLYLIQDENSHVKMLSYYIHLNAAIILFNV